MNYYYTKLWENIRKWLIDFYPFFSCHNSIMCCYFFHQKSSRFSYSWHFQYKKKFFTFLKSTWLKKEKKEQYVFITNLCPHEFFLVFEHSILVIIFYWLRPKNWGIDNVRNQLFFCFCFLIILFVLFFAT